MTQRAIIRQPLSSRSLRYLMLPFWQQQIDALELVDTMSGLAVLVLILAGWQGKLEAHAPA